jgi:phosphate transport system protein
MTHLEEELKALKQEVSKMFALVHSQIERSFNALQNFDKDIALQIISTEKRVNALELKIDLDCENYFALYNPVAVDLRYVLAVLKINSNLERIGDIAEGIARFIIQSDTPFSKELIEQTRTNKMFEVALKMLDDVEDAFNAEDTSLARTLFKQDAVLDEINFKANNLIAELIRSNIETIDQALHLLSIIRKLERVGDQAKNIAEEIIFYIEAKVVKHSRKL